MAQIGAHTNVPIEINLIRHMVLNQIRSLREKFCPKYGSNFIVAADGRHYWRKDVFPYYKANRSKARKKSDFDWQSMFDCLNQLKDELREFMPYPVIQHDKAEADDVIATLVMEHGTVLNTSGERILIVSGDGDFAQLQRFANVDQYDPIRKKDIVAEDPHKYLREHIVRGDTGDGIPNILSPDDTFVSNQRQKKVTEKILNHWLAQDEDDITDQGYRRNKQLIDLTQIPQWLKDEILAEYRNQLDKTRDKMLNYFIQSRLKLLIEHLQEF